MNGSLTIVHAQSLACVFDDNQPRAGRAQGELNIISDGAIAIRDGRIAGVGTTEEIVRRFRDDAPVLDATGKTVLPGLVECHSHPIFAGNRHWEYVRRLEGASGREIRAEGGGIWSTVENTRKATDDELVRNAVRAFEQIAAGGVTTLEVKSGYGLSKDGELRLLRLLEKAAGQTRMDIVFTFLGAHIAPQDGCSTNEFVESVKNEMLPAVLEQGIAESQDLSCENGDFSAEQAKELIESSIALGLPVHVHADASSDSRGWRTAVEGGALSADHLTYTPDAEINAVGAARTVAVLLPVAEQFYLDERKANGRLFIKNHVPVAVATDYCSSFQATSLPLTIAAACSWFRFTPSEAIVGATLNAAYALGRNLDRGSLDVGKRGDVTIFDCAHPNQLGTAIGAPLVDMAISQGTVIWEVKKQHSENLMMTSLTVKLEASSVEKVAATLRRAIFKGTFLPGDQLKEVALSRSLGVSRGSVREALRILATEELVVHLPNKGASVRTLSLEEIDDIFLTRHILEIKACECIPTASDHLLQAVVESTVAYEAVANLDDPATIANAHINYHKAIVGLTGSLKLAELEESLMQTLQVIIACIENDRDLSLIHI
eukprot:TRINITY_DN50969_c0_g1_i1.p1 TRINITY_DN50969_c0_g1~~TRINITY_DN50969_c0_g1_i1.p1  ORF type:complete len:604 (-),score=138.20 TRINITY_DN50969_c0_g1_i1:113-1924(-)